MTRNDEYRTEAGLDRMLSSFFKAELPDPFPPLKLPARAEAPMAVASRSERRTPVSQSRFALAASVALILGGCWYLSGQIGSPTAQPNVGHGQGDSAKLGKELQKGNENAKKESPAMP
ncbi:MAG: hypothetical protein K8T89_07440 [Planctomycetes bacterium]|nr:hypothetical protein [Planctomycetota bacterium]